MKMGMVAREGRQPAGHTRRNEGGRVEARQRSAAQPSSGKPSRAKPETATGQARAPHRLTRQRVDARLVVQRLRLALDGVLVLAVLRGGGRRGRDRREGEDNWRHAERCHGGGVAGKDARQIRSAEPCPPTPPSNPLPHLRLDRVNLRLELLDVERALHLRQARVMGHQSCIPTAASYHRHPKPSMHGAEEAPHCRVL